MANEEIKNEVVEEVTQQEERKPSINEVVEEVTQQEERKPSIKDGFAQIKAGFKECGSYLWNHRTEIAGGVVGIGAMIYGVNKYKEKQAIEEAYVRENTSRIGFRAESTQETEDEKTE